MWIPQAMLTSQTSGLLGLYPLGNRASTGPRSGPTVADGRHRRSFKMANCPNNPICSLTGLSPPRCVLPTAGLHCRNNPTKIFTGSFIWEGVDATGVKSKILNGDRPRRLEGEKKSNVATGLWRTFPRCWEKEPDSRISVSKVLDLLRYL